MLTHERTEYERLDTYLWEKLSPVRPLLSFGRSSKAYPQTPPKFCVWHWWQDLNHKITIPAMLFNDHLHP